jgi:O-antigen/teichoic acid export membrane protein
VAGSVIFFIARLLPSLLGVITTALLTRLLDPAAYGMYALGLSIIFFITIGAFEWLGLSVMRMVTSAKQQDLFLATVVGCFGVISSICATVVAGAALFDHSMGMFTFSGACLFAGLANAWVELKQRLQMAELNRKAYFRTNIGRGLLSITLITTTACFFNTAPALLLATGSSALLASFLHREPRLSFLRSKFDPKVLRSLLRFGLPLSISVGLATILMSIDKWMLQGLSGSHAVGLFSAAALIAQVPIGTLANCIGPYTYSMAVEAVEFKSTEAANLQLHRNFALLLGLVLPGAAGIIALSQNLAHVVVGSDYTDAVIHLTPWLAGSAVFTSMRAFYVDTAFQLAHKVSALTWINLIAIAVNVILDFFLIPSAGELGAAMSSFVATLVSLVVASVWSLRVFPLSVPLVGAIKIGASTLGMFIVLHGLTRFFGPTALVGQLTIGLVVYLVAVLGSNVLGVRHHLNERLPRITRRLLRAR